jgi:hypothetical protein
MPTEINASAMPLAFSGSFMPADRAIARLSADIRRAPALASTNNRTFRKLVGGL